MALGPPKIDMPYSSYILLLVLNDHNFKIYLGRQFILRKILLYETTFLDYIKMYFFEKSNESAL